MSISRKLSISAVTLLAAFGLSAATISQPITHVSAHRRYYRVVRHRRRGRRYHYRRAVRRHRLHRVRRTRSYYRTQVRRRRARALAAKRRRDAFTRHHIDIILNAAKPKPRRVHHYHILVDGVDDGWTTNYRTYKNSVNEIKADIQKDEQQMQAQQEASDQQSQEDTDQSDQAQPTDDSSQQTQTTDQTQSSQPADTDTDDDTQAGNGVGTGTTPQLTQFAQQMQADEIKDINNDREANGEQPYTEDPELDQVAQIRADQNPTGHYNAQGQPENGVIAQQLGYLPAGPDNFYSENLGSDFIGKHEIEDGYTDNTSTPARAAHSLENALTNHDQDNDNEHRYNILTNDNSKVGVGVYCSKDNYNRPQYMAAEEFE